MKRTSFKGDDCSVARALDAVGDWWTLLIVREALVGVRRFGGFQRKLHIAKNILAARLKALVEDGILEKVPPAPGGVYSEYVLTPKGRGISPILLALRQWSEEFLDEKQGVGRLR